MSMWIMLQGAVVNVRGLTSSRKQGQVVRLVGNNSFALLTEVKNKCHLPGPWLEFFSNCNGVGGAAVLLHTSTFPHATLLHVSEHAVAVQANKTVFISLYIPCRATWADIDYVLDWIPDPSVNCIIGGDWNRFAQNERWIKALSQRGLHLCPCPTAFTRICPYSGKVSFLDRVATTVSASNVWRPLHFRTIWLFLCMLGPRRWTPQGFPGKCSRTRSSWMS